jgi:cytochrome c biogenesis protein CcdA
MNHLPFIAAAYGLGVAIPLVFAATAAMRARSAKRRLAAVEAVRP